VPSSSVTALPTLAPHAVSFLNTSALASFHEAVVNAASFADICQAAAAVRARCHMRIAGRPGGSAAVSYCGQQDGNGLPHGHGLLALTDCSFYFGSFVHGQRQGTGVAVFPEASGPAFLNDGGAGELPSLSSIALPALVAPRPCDVAKTMQTPSSSQTPAHKALQQLRELRVDLDDLVACSYRPVLSFGSVSKLTLYAAPTRVIGPMMYDFLQVLISHVNVLSRRPPGSVCSCTAKATASANAATCIPPPPLPSTLILYPPPTQRQCNILLGLRENFCTAVLTQARHCVLQRYTL
jgi:hypothetical protein